jgi:hypothetical protein
VFVFAIGKGPCDSFLGTGLSLSNILYQQVHLVQRIFRLHHDGGDVWGTLVARMIWYSVCGGLIIVTSLSLDFKLQE